MNSMDELHIENSQKIHPFQQCKNVTKVFYQQALFASFYEAELYLHFRCKRTIPLVTFYSKPKNQKRLRKQVLRLLDVL